MGILVCCFYLAVRNVWLWIIETIKATSYLQLAYVLIQALPKIVNCPKHSEMTGLQKLTANEKKGKEKSLNLYQIFSMFIILFIVDFQVDNDVLMS